VYDFGTEGFWNRPSFCKYNKFLKVKKDKIEVKKEIYIVDKMKKIKFKE